MDNRYAGRKVLSIGARKKVLIKFSEELSKEGFSATWTDHMDPEFVLNEFNAENFDVITFGRGVSSENNRIYREKFSRQKPSITFVNGLAPISNLLVDQVKLAIGLPTDVPVFVHLCAGGLRIISPAPGKVTVKQYVLSWLFHAREKIIFDKLVSKGEFTIPVEKKGGKNFVVAKMNGVVFFVAPV
jgi:hypothetical protein